MSILTLNPTRYIYLVLYKQTVGGMPEILYKYKTLYKIKSNFTSHFTCSLAP